MLHRLVVEPSEKCITSIAILSLYRRNQSVDCSDSDENETSSEILVTGMITSIGHRQIDEEELVRYLPKVIDQRIKLIAQIGRCWRLADGD
jgi:hypothetical protein